MMHALFANHDILIFPIIALALFASVFIAVVVRTFRQTKAEHQAHAMLALEAELQTSDSAP